MKQHLDQDQQSRGQDRKLGQHRRWQLGLELNVELGHQLGLGLGLGLELGQQLGVGWRPHMVVGLGLARCMAMEQLGVVELALVGQL
jgi:hypothetical protein